MAKREQKPGYKPPMRHRLGCPCPRCEPMHVPWAVARKRDERSVSLSEMEDRAIEWARLEGCV